MCVKPYLTTLDAKTLYSVQKPDTLTDPLRADLARNDLLVFVLPM